MAKDNLKSNIGYQSIYQIISIITPIITSPYISRILGASHLGEYSYTSSVVGYFAIFALLGTSTYGTKEIAAVKEDRKKASEVFWEIYAFQFAASVISIICFFVFSITLGADYKSLFLCQSLTVVAILLDINWLYFGLEDFKYTVKRNLIAKIISLFCIFVFVKSQDDLLLYAIFVSLANCIGNALFWITLHKKIDYIIAPLEKIKKRIKPNLVLFVPIVATSVFHVMDKTMLGILCDSYQSGYYYNSSKMMDIPLSVITGLSTVLLARMSFLAENKQDDSGKKGSAFIQVGLIILFPMSFGVAAIAPTFCPWFFGPGYEECSSVLVILCVAMVFKGLSAMVRSVFLIPFSMNKEYLSAVIWGAIINIVANTIFILVFDMGARGAAFGTVLAEMAVCLIQFGGIWNYNKRHTEVKLNISLVRVGYLLGISAVMFICVRLINQMIPVNQQFVSLCIQLLIGGITFFILLSPLIVYSKRAKMKGNLE